MFLWLLLLLTIVPFVEIVLLLRIAGRWEWGPTLALVLLTGVVGAWLARREGIKTLAKIQSDMQSGVAPTGAMLDGVMILIAGIVLVTPGILTDLVGFALLVPPVRRWIGRRVAAAIKKRVVVMRPDFKSPFVDVQSTGRNAEPQQQVSDRPKELDHDGA